ncbi:exonuclease V [Mycena haematopus]|nr:exonuclease V [Mycena haematopus]
MSDDSEYEAYNDFAGLSEEDFARLDAATSSLLNPGMNVSDSSPTAQSHIDPAMPSISIELEGSYPSAEVGSPIHRYRYRTGTLSVTDLISLAWCELQFDYGLRQRRYRKLANRPASFRAESGKEITVQQDIAARNDKTTKRGQVLLFPRIFYGADTFVEFIHKELELELRPEEEIEVVVTNEEERWAFRLINFLSSLVSLRAEDRAREIPVFGIVDGVVVVGIIDELLIRDKSEPETGTKTRFGFVPPFPKASVPKPNSTFTRRRDSLPSDEDTESAQLQVMLYHRLLTHLLDTSALFDFSVVWTSLGLRHSAPFSPAFLKQTTQILGPDSVPIIYRSQNKYSRRSGKGKGREDTMYIPAIREDEELAKAIEMSLEDVFEGELAAALKESAALANALPAAFDLETQTGPDQEGVQGHGTFATGLDLSLVSGPSTGTLGSDNDQAQSASALVKQSTLADIGDSPLPRETGATRREIIGTKEFTVNDTILDTFLHNALDWWRGKRAARGVSDRQTNRCYSCEYQNDCEWREQKALERLAQAKHRRGSKEATSPRSRRLLEDATNLDWLTPISEFLRVVEDAKNPNQENVAVWPQVDEMETGRIGPLDVYMYDLKTTELMSVPKLRMRARGLEKSKERRTQL